MPLDLYDGLDLLLLALGYWLVDLLVRRDGFLRMLRRAGLARENHALTLWLAPLALLIPFWSWSSLPQGDLLRWLALSLTAVLAWQAATKDIDPVTGEAHTVPRLLLLASVAGIPFSPACLLMAGFLLTTPFGLWQHHATLPMRLLQALMAHLLLSTVLTAGLAGAGLAGAPLFRDASALVFFLLVVLVSHYVITALAKMLLGPKWYSWVTDNRLHHLAASAYSWGWARFLPWPVWLQVIAVFRRVEKPFQFLAFALELLAPLALLHPRAAVALSLAFAAFHLGVFACSGLLFWDWILTDLILAAFFALLPASVADQAFGILPAAAGLVFMALFPLRHKLWKPMPLGWFDTPLTQRVHWRVRGEGGDWYGLYNDFMCPHERLYGKVHGCFLAPVPVMTYHLGEVWKPDLRDAIRAAGPDLDRLQAVRDRYGISPRCEIRSARHQAYLRLFFQALNRGARKHVLPRGLRWLKAPGDQIFYWGDLPPWRGRELAVQVSLHYREEYFDGRELRRLREETLLVIDIEDGKTLEPPGPAGRPFPPGLPSPVREPTPKEIDDFLLGFAAGRLIDLPGFGGGYVKGDDGKLVLGPTCLAGGKSAPAGQPESASAAKR